MNNNINHLINFINQVDYESPFVYPDNSDILLQIVE